MAPILMPVTPLRSPKSESPLAFVVRITNVEAPCATRSASADRLGTSCPATLKTVGSSRTTRSRSGTKFIAPRPVAGSRSAASGNSAPVKDGRNGGEPGLDDRLRAVLGEGHAEHELAAPDRLRKHTVAFRLRGGGSLRLGEEHVEHHGGGSRRGELVDQRGELDARPGPLPEPLQRLVVDRDDADRPCGPPRIHCHAGTLACGAPVGVYCHDWSA